MREKKNLNKTKSNEATKGKKVAKAKGTGKKIAKSEKVKEVKREKVNEAVKLTLRVVVKILVMVCNLIKRYIHIIIGVPLTAGGIYLMNIYKDIPYEEGTLEKMLSFILLSLGVTIFFSKTLNKVLRGEYSEEVDD